MNNYISYEAIRTDLIEGKVTCKQLVNYYLAQIKRFNTEYNAFLEVFSESAFSRASLIDHKISNGTAGQLAGLVIGIKDLFCYKGHSMSCGSKILEGFESQITATALQRLLDEDAIIIGRQNCDEFAMGSSNENSAYGAVSNAANLHRVPGGSSGGSAVAVQADMCQVSIASDTGGSIRQPAAFTGLVGIKPTYSRVSRYGLTAYGSSFDSVGVLSKSVYDTALCMEIMAGFDQLDGTSSRKKVPKYTHSLSKTKYTIVVFNEIYEVADLHEDIKKAFNNLINKLTDEGHKIKRISFAYQDYLLPTYHILTAAEASSNLSRYDGVRYGYRFPQSANLEDMYKQSRTLGLGHEVLHRIILGAFVLSANHQDAFYTKAQQVRRLIKDFTEQTLQNNDFILMPTTPSTAFEIGSKTKDQLQMYRADIFTVQASLAGVTAISLPFGADENNLPIGLQLIANSFEEHKMLDFSRQLLNE